MVSVTGKRERDTADLTDNKPETEQEFLSLPRDRLTQWCGQYTFNLLMCADLDKPNTKMAGNVDVVFVKRLVGPRAAQVGAVCVDPIGSRLTCRR